MTPMSCRPVALAMLLGLAACAEERGACIIRTVCFANQPKAACEAQRGEYMGAATPAEAASKCKAGGYLRPFTSTPANRDLSEKEVDDRFAADDKVAFARP